MISSISNSKIILLFVLITVLILPNFQILAQEKNLEELCPKFEELEEKLSSEDYQELLEKCEAYYVEIIKQTKANITKTEKEKRTRLNQISILRNRIGKLDTQVRQGNIAIRNLSTQIHNTELSIEETSLKIENSREKLAGILRAIHRENQISPVEIFLEGKTLSNFFNNLIALETLNIENKRILGQIEALKLFLEGEKELAMNEKDAIGNIVTIQILQRKEGDKMKRKEERFYRMADAEFEQYQKEKEKAEKKAIEIRARILHLIGAPELKLGDALKVAERVQQQTGVQPAFLLAIIIQESALGRNVGQCFITDATTGNTRDRHGNFFNHGRGIKRDRDLSLFLEIAREFGINNDPFQTPISCFIRWNGCARRNHWGRLVFSNAFVSPQGLTCPKGFYFFGFGGAIGPAQFLPSTWVKKVRDETSAILNRTANPWRIKDSFLGSAIYLKKRGALVNEINAAARYFGAAGLGYESRVMRIRRCLQKFINEDRMTSECKDLIFHFQ